MRIGINIKYCNLRNFGSYARLDYNAIGGEVNLASRFETNINVGQILISYESHALIKYQINCKKN